MVLPRRIRLAPLAFAAAVTVAGCAESTAGGGAYDYSCPATPLLQVSLIDVSASARNEGILGERLDAVQVDAEKVADCDGELVVAAWAGASSSSSILFSGPVPVDGATEIGKDRKIPEAVAKVMSDVRDNLTTSLATLSPDSSDLIGGLYLISDVVGSKGADRTVVAHVYTDGISTGGAIVMNDGRLTQATVDALVAKQSVPGLLGVEVKLFGIGRTAADVAPPQDFIQLVQNYTAAICGKTGANCSVYTTVVL